MLTSIWTLTYSQNVFSFTPISFVVFLMIKIVWEFFDCFLTPFFEFLIKFSVQFQGMLQRILHSSVTLGEMCSSLIIHWTLSLYYHKLLTKLFENIQPKNKLKLNHLWDVAGLSMWLANESTVDKEVQYFIVVKSYLHWIVFRYNWIYCSVLSMSPDWASCYQPLMRYFPNNVFRHIWLQKYFCFCFCSCPILINLYVVRVFNP